LLLESRKGLILTFEVHEDSPYSCTKLRRPQGRRTAPFQHLSTNMLNSACLLCLSSSGTNFCAKGEIVAWGVEAWGRLCLHY